MGWVYTMRLHIEGFFKQGDMPSLMRVASMYLTPMMTMIGTPLALTSVKYYPKLVIDPRIGNPILPLHFLFAISLQISSLCGFLFSLPAMESFSTFVAGTSFVFLYITLMTSTFIIGVATASFNNFVDAKLKVLKEKSAAFTGEQILAEYQAVKSLLSPILFLSIVFQSMVAVSFSYEVMASSGQVTFAIGLTNAIVFLSYVCFAVEKTQAKFKSVTENLW